MENKTKTEIQDIKRQPFKIELGLEVYCLGILVILYEYGEKSLALSAFIATILVFGFLSSLRRF